MKNIEIAAFIFLLFCPIKSFRAAVILGAVQQKSSEPVTKNSEKQDTKPGQSAPIKPTMTSPNDENNGQNIKHENSEQQVRISSLPNVTVTKSTDVYDRVLTICTALLVLIGGAQILFLWHTVQVTKIAAESAQLSADSLINSERAWLLMKEFHGYLLVPSPGNQMKPSCCGFSLKNYGKTPAKLIKWRMELQIGNNPNAPDKNIYDSPWALTNYHPSVIAQGEDAPQIVYFADERKTINQDEMTEIQGAETKFLWLCGIFQYEDVFRANILHETRLCYIYDPIALKNPIFRLAGPSEYNRTT